VSLKYSEENQLILMNLLRGYGFLSRDGSSNSCDPYVITEMKYNEEKVHAQTHTKITTISENDKILQSKPAGCRFTRSHSLQHGYDHVTSTRKQLPVGDYVQVSTVNCKSLVSHKFFS